MVRAGMGDMADVKAFWCFDTWGVEEVEAAATGAHAAMGSTVTHINDPIQTDSLILSTNTLSDWESNSFAVTGDDFIVGFWVYIDNSNMGVAASQNIIEIFTDGGTTADITLKHTSNFPSVSFDWDLLDAGGTSRDSVTDPFAEDKWVWCNLYYKRHDTTGQGVLFVYNDYPSTTKAAAMNFTGQDTEAAGAGATMVIKLHGRIAAPIGGDMTWYNGGMYAMDGVTASITDQLDHQEFHSLRPELNSATPHIEWDGSAPEAEDDLDAGTWDLAGDFNAATFGQYNAGNNKGGAVQTEDYDLSTKILSDDHNIGKFVYGIQLQRFGSGSYVYGYYLVDAGTYSVANAALKKAGNARDFEHFIASGDAQWPVMSNNPAIRAIPVIGIKNGAVGAYIRFEEGAFVRMWPKGAPGVSVGLSRMDHFTRGVSRGISKGVNR